MSLPAPAMNGTGSSVLSKDKFLSGPILKLQEIVKSYDNIDYLHSLTGGVLIDG